MVQKRARAAASVCPSPSPSGVVGLGRRVCEGEWEPLQSCKHRQSCGSQDLSGQVSGLRGKGQEERRVRWRRKQRQMKFVPLL